MTDLANKVRKTYHDGPRKELFDGTWVVSQGPSVSHHDVAFNIGIFFRSKFKGKTYRVFVDSLSLHLSKDNIFVPDVMIISDMGSIKAKGVYAPPVLVAEVLSPSSLKRDKIDKKNAYEKFGVNEYWIVDIKNKSIEVYVLKNSRLVLHDVYITISQDDIDDMADEEKTAIVYENKIPSFEDFGIDIREIFEGIE